MIDHKFNIMFGASDLDDLLSVDGRTDVAPNATWLGRYSWNYQLDFDKVYLIINVNVAWNDHVDIIYRICGQMI